MRLLPTSDNESEPGACLYANHENVNRSSRALEIIGAREKKAIARTMD